jgi:hypothetical protein
MSWSDPQKLVVSKPTFKVVPTPAGKKFKVVPSKPVARTTQIVRLTWVQTSSSQNDLPPKGKSVGDKLYGTDQLLNVGAQFGKSAGAAVGSERVTSTITGATTASVVAVVTLPGGTITLGGNSTINNSTITLKVTGGTGAFAGAQGTTTENGNTDTYVLSLPGA